MEEDEQKISSSDIASWEDIVDKWVESSETEKDDVMVANIGDRLPELCHFLKRLRAQLANMDLMEALREIPHTGRLISKLNNLSPLFASPAYEQLIGCAIEYANSSISTHELDIGFEEHSPQTMYQVPM
jgi:hypothetical protein